jgi:prepilin-type N-terminal cleavage/methylation domain-containing protein
MKNRKDEGFTLIELLIVIVILGILATIVVFAVRGVTDQGQTSACNADKKTIETAIEAYYAQNGNKFAITEPNLVTYGLIREESTNYNIGTVVNGVLQVVPASPGKCV